MWSRRFWVIRAAVRGVRVQQAGPGSVVGHGALPVAPGWLPGTLVWDREGALHAGGGRASDALVGFCGQLGVGWYLCEAADPQAKGLVERLQGYMQTSFEPGRTFVGPEDFQAQLDAWSWKANRRSHRTLRARPVDLLGEERDAMRPLPAAAPDADRRFVTRVMADPFVRVDTCDYSLDPRLSGMAGGGAPSTCSPP